MSLAWHTGETVTNGPPTPPRRIPAYMWVVLAVIAGLNFLYNYYHPLGWFIDVVIVVAFLIKRAR